jgi:C4-dicarboxylate transporter DctQ subunit
MTFVRSLDRLLIKIESAFLVLFLGTMIVLAFTQVVLRNLFDTGFLWGDTLVRHLVLWAGFTGAAIATSEERHISIDALTKFISPRVKSVVQILTNLFAVIVCCLLAQAALTFLSAEKEAGGSLILSVPSWIGLIVIAPGYSLMALHFVLKVIEDAMKMSGASGEAL